MMTTKKITTQSIVLVALFAALTFVGTMIRIPMPTGAFAHLGNAMLLLAVLLLGYKKGALAGGLGFAIFDLLNGFAIEAPYFILESFIVGGVAALTILAFHGKIDRIGKIITVASITGIAKIIMTQLKNTVALMLTGSDLPVAFAGAVTKLLPTVINVVTTIIIVSLVYFPLKKQLMKIFNQSTF